MDAPRPLFPAIKRLRHVSDNDCSRVRFGASERDAVEPSALLQQQGVALVDGVHVHDSVLVEQRGRAAFPAQARGCRGGAQPQQRRQGSKRDSKAGHSCATWRALVPQNKPLEPNKTVLDTTGFHPATTTTTPHSHHHTTNCKYRYDNNSYRYIAIIAILRQYCNIVAIFAILQLRGKNYCNIAIRRPSISPRRWRNRALLVFECPLISSGQRAVGAPAAHPPFIPLGGWS